MTADLAEEHSTATLAAERLENEQADRLKLEKENMELQVGSVACNSEGIYIVKLSEFSGRHSGRSNNASFFFCAEHIAFCPPFSLDLYRSAVILIHSLDISRSISDAFFIHILGPQ